MADLIPEQEAQKRRALIPLQEGPLQDDHTNMMVRKYGGRAAAPVAAAPLPAVAPAPVAAPAIAAPVSSGDDYTDMMVRKYGGRAAKAAKPPVPEKPIGLMGTVKQGAISTARSLGATADTVQGDEADVVATAKAAQAAPQDPKFTALMGDIAERRKKLGDDPGWLDSLKAVGGAVADNPMGAVHLVAGQLPNAAVALGAGAAGAAAGSIAGPVGAVIGGIAGLFSANTALETGGKAIEAATDGSYGKEEQRRVLKEGAIKGGVITGVDVATLGLTKWMMNTTRRAMETATTKVLTDSGVDVGNKIAVEAAQKNPEILAAVQKAQADAQKATDKLGRKLSRGTGALALESLGEGTGEYLGEYAATGKADKVDAIIEAVSSLGQSAGEVAFTNSLNKKALTRLFATRQEAENVAVEETKATGVPHVAEPHPTEPDKFVAVPKARSTSGLPLDESRIHDIESRPGFTHTAEDRLRLKGRDRALEAGYAANPLATSSTPPPPAAPPTPPPTIGGRDVTGLSNAILAYTASKGSMRAQAVASAEMQRRRVEGVDPAIANAPESTPDAVSRILTTGRERSQEVTSGKAATAQPVTPDMPTPEPAATIAAQIMALTEGRKPGVLLTPGEAHPGTLPEGIKSADIPGRGTLLYRDDATLQHALAGRMGKALGYGTNEKPAAATHAVTARDGDGTVIHDVAVDADGAKAALDAATKVAGPEGKVEERPIAEVMAEREEDVVNAATTKQFKGYSAHIDKMVKEGANLSQLSGMLDQINADERLNDGEAAQLLKKWHAAAAVQTEAVATAAKKHAENHADLKKRASAVYARVRDEAAADPTEENRHPLWKEQNEEKIGNPSRYHPVVEEENPKGFKIGDAVTDKKGRRGYVASIQTQGRRQAVLVVHSSTYGGWDDVADVTRASDTTPTPAPQPADNGVRELVEALIKRRAAANQNGKGRTFDKVLDAAKLLLKGETVLPARFKSAAAILKGDPVTAGILNALFEKATAAQKAAKTATVATPAAPEKLAGKRHVDLRNDAVQFISALNRSNPGNKAADAWKGFSDASKGKEAIKEEEFNEIWQAMVPKKGAAVPDTKAKKTTAGPDRAALEAHFAPGNVILSSYWREHDRVVSFDWNNGNWKVKVERVKKDADGNWKASDQPRTHATYPDKKDVVVEHAKLKADIQDFVDGKTDTVPDIPPPVPEKAATPDPKKVQAIRKKAERDLHVIASTNPELMTLAGTMDLASFTEGVNEALAKEVPRIANEYGGPEKDAVLALVVDGKAVLPKEFYASSYKAAKAAWEEQQKIEARDPQLYKDTLGVGMGVAGIDPTSTEGAEYKQGFDHALKGKTKSTLPQGGKHVTGYEDARAWVKTKDGKAWFEGKRQAKEKSTGEALKRHWERVRKDIGSVTSVDMKKAWATILKATTRAELFSVALPEDATPGAKAWLANFRGELATFQEFYTREMIDQQNSGKRYYANADDVFKGKYTSSSGRASNMNVLGVDVTEEMAGEREKAKQAVIDIYDALNSTLTHDAPSFRQIQKETIADESKWQNVAAGFSTRDNHAQTSAIYQYFQKIDAKKQDKARLELTKQIALEYQTHLVELSAKFQNAESLADIRKVIEAEYGTVKKYTIGTDERGDRSLYHDNRRKIEALFPADPAAWDYKYSSWKALEETENAERQQGERKDTLMRPRLDRIERNMPDERKGRSISAAELKKTFGFADVTIGEYVTAKEAEDHLNYAYDAFHSLALILGAKPKQLSFGGTLHFSIGALGHGKYAAHFNPGHEKADGTRVPVINVTKTRGDGSVLHEYFHAIDFMTIDPALKKAIQSVKRLLKGTPKSPEALLKNVDSFLLGRTTFTKMGRNATPKDHALQGLNGWYRAGGNGSIETTNYYQAARDLDKGSGDKPYWSNEYEPWARASESWGFDKLTDSKQRDDYLQSDWVADGKVTKKTHRGTPYPQSGERERLNALMDEFTRAIEWTDAGPVLKADHAWHTLLPFDALMKPYAATVQHAIDNIDALASSATARMAKEAADRKAEQERKELEKIFGAEPPVPAPVPEPDPVVVPTPSSEPEGDAPLSEDELSSIFDEVAESMREETQDKPDAPEPGEVLDAQGWSREDVFYIIDLVMQGKMVLLSGEPFAKDHGLPTIHDFHGKAEVKHVGYGLFEAKNTSYTVTWIAGGGMDHTPGGKAYTVAVVTKGTFLYPKDEVLNALHSLVGNTPAKQPEAAPPPADKAKTPPKSPPAAKAKTAKAPPKAKPLPDLAEVQDKTAAVLAAEFAKHGVKGIDKTLSGLVKLFGGGPSKLQSFPGGFDEKTYAQAKVLFKEAAEEFRASGISFKEFVRVFFKTLISQFGDGVKPYAVRFAKEYQDSYENVEVKEEAVNPAPVDAEASPSARLSDWVLDNLTAGTAMTWQELFAQGDIAFGGTQAEARYTPKDAYDAVELGINRYILQEQNINPAMIGDIFARANVKNAEKLLQLVPTQSKRTAEMDEFQQFSTPPHFSFIANWVANLRKTDTYLEPSAGVGGLAVYAKVAGVNKIVVNELSARRLALLQNLPFDRYFSENGEQLNNVLPENIRPTVIVMNPPFSATGGRMQGVRDTMNGANHIEQALKRLAPDGRLVAIVGEGMGADKPAFTAWWSKIRKEYNVRANIGVSGASYAKYGTTFDNQILVIDKDGPTTGNVIAGKVDHPADLIEMLSGVRNDRPHTTAVNDDSDLASGAGGKKAAEDSGGAENTSTTVVVDTSGMGGGRGSGGGRPGGKSGTGDAGVVGDSNDKTGSGNEDSDKPGRGGKDGHVDGTNQPNDKTGDNPGDDKSGEPNDANVSNSVFEPYAPKKVAIEGSVAHNTPLVESSAMASVSPPDPTYTPNLPKKVITSGALSDAQLEAVVYAGQAHAQMGRDGVTRRGFFVGDGTGLGKGREISGIILDNMRQGRTKAIWLSKKKELMEDAKRDFGDIGGDTSLIFSQAKHKHNDKILPKTGILFTAYPTIRSPSKEARLAQNKAGKKRLADDDGISYERVRQIVAWVGKDFDGIIAFDEAHEMGNAIAMKGARGSSEPSQTALAGLELQKALPNARVVYVSATGATEVQNLAYAPRLGLWGDGTPFAGVEKFVDAMSQSVSAMELVAQNLKQMGLYTARSLSYDGVTYEQLLHQLTPYQQDTYNLLAEGWQVVLQNIDKAMEQTGLAKEGGGAATSNSGRLKGNVLSQFWSAHQRFFNQIITASQMPSVIEQIETDLKNGKAVVLQLTNTDEASQTRALGAAAARAASDDKSSDEEVEELDLTPREQLITFMEKSFPVIQYEKYIDPDDGIEKVRAVKDSRGFVVINREAEAMRDTMIKNIRAMRIPDSPLQILFDQFGGDKIAEITGRSKRIVRGAKGKIEPEKRGPAAVAADSQAFKDGKKNILVFSGAGGTGFSFHSDKRYKNRKQRAHYILQAGWSADKAVQGFGRTHRTNQENAPIYRLVKTDIPAHARFISSIARRLEQLGALTAGQRDTAGGSIFSASDNLESEYAKHAVREIFMTMARGIGYPGQPADLLKQMGLQDIISPTTGAIVEAKIPTTTKFLNRLLSVRLDTQKGLFDYFMHTLTDQVEGARRMGTFDDGLETIEHTGAKIVQEKEVYRDPLTNAEVLYRQIQYTTPNPFYDFDEVQSDLKGLSGRNGWFKNKVSGRVAGVRETSMTRTHKDGTIGNLFSMARTGGTSYDTAREINFDSFERIEVPEARALWEKENSVRPKSREHDLHMVVGGILPLWDRFNAEHVQVVRIALDDGQRLLGRKIADKDLVDTLKKLDVKSAAAQMTGRELMQHVLDGKKVELSNGWILKKVRVSNDPRVEIDTIRQYLSANQEEQIKGAGAFYERIEWKSRYFVPTNLDDGGKVIDALLKKIGANAVNVQGVDDTVTPDDAPAFSRGANASSAVLSKSKVQSIVDAIRAKWKNAPEVILVDGLNDSAVPKAVRAENDRQLSMGATGNPEGFVYGGKVYIVVSEMKSAGDVMRVLLHESIGHFGLRGAFGAQLQPILKQLAALRRSDVAAKAKLYGLDMSKESDRLIAAEEVLAELAQTNPKNGLVQRAIAAIRTWLRENVPSLFRHMEMTDAEIINNFLIPAREFVKRGRAETAPATSLRNPALSRSTPQTETPAFKKWFAGSKVVGADGKPLVVYHGTNSEFSSFEENKIDAKGGFWFAENPEFAKSFGDKRREVFLNITRPFDISDATERYPLNVWKDIFDEKGVNDIVFDSALSDHPNEAFAFNELLPNKGNDLYGDGNLIELIEKSGFDGILAPDERASLSMGDRSTGAAWITFNPEQIKSATGNNGAFDASNPDIRFSRSATATAPATPIRDRMDKVVDSLIYNFQDRFKPLKDIQKRAGAVPESRDAALAEERYSGMVRSRTDDFETSMRDPLIKAIHESKVEYEDVEDYLHARHAPSRNAAMQEINPTEAQLQQQTATLTQQREKLANDADVLEFLDKRRELKLAEADIEDGIADESLGRMLGAELTKLKQSKAVRDYTSAIDKLRALRLVKPFVGDNTALSGMSDTESEAILAKAKANGTEAALQRIAAITDAITTKTREIFVESGLETAETIKAWNDKYEHYVPLHRDEVGGGTGNPAVGRGFNVRGRESKRATGSNKEVTDILAHIVAQHEAAIIRSEKTKVDHALFAFAKANPDPALWTLDTADMIRTVDRVSGLVVNRVDPTYKQRDNVLTLKIAGNEHTITFNEKNLEGMRLATSMKNLSSQEMGEVTRVIGKFTRFLATMSTTANPVFLARNFLRDLQTSFVNLSDTELAGKKKEVFRDVPAAIRGMWDLSRGNTSSKWAKYAAEFRAAGAQTGWMEHYKNIGERADRLRAEVEVLGPGKLNLAKRTAAAWWEVVEDANNAVENGVRLAAYVNARQGGMTEGKAASLAKNLTVNFNAHGAKGVELNAWYMFLNASIQGSARLIKAMGNKKVRGIVAGVVLSGFLMDILARSLTGDEDDDGENDYDQLPEHTKAMNWVFMVDGRPVTVPQPYGYNFFSTLGRKVSEMMFREEYTAVQGGIDLANSFFGAFSPVGQAGSMLQAVAPTVADPFLQWSENKNFAGNPLRREQHPFGTPNPEYQMGFKSTSAPAKWLAETLNDISGGNEVRPGMIDANPALFDFTVASIAGGAGKSYLQALSLPIKVAGDDEIQAREVPFANIFLSAKPEQQVENKYFTGLKKVQMAKDELKAYKGNAEMVAQIRADHGNELKLVTLASTTQRKLTGLRKKDMKLDKADAPNKHELKKINDEKRRALMSHFNKRYREALSAQ